jgi:hypothetical protein
MQAVNKAEMPTTHHTCDHIVCLFVHVIVFVFVRLCGGFFECLFLFYVSVLYSQLRNVAILMFPLDLNSASQPASQSANHLQHESHQESMFHYDTTANIDHNYG